MTTTTTPVAPPRAPAPPVRGPWQDVPRAPERPLHRVVARAAFRTITRRLPLRVVLPDGTTWGPSTPGAPALRIRREAFFDRLGAHGVIGFGEGYIVGDWDADGDLAALLLPFASRTPDRVPSGLRWLRHRYVPRQPVTEENTIHGARANIHRHYDLSNELFALFLDDSMTYSSALFGPGETLEAAQVRKIERLLDAAAVGPDRRVLEIGTGWGALAIRAARRGALVRTITLSREQQELARERIAAAGVADRVEVALCDYRDVEGTYDAVVSVEMIEAVGDQFWPVYFRTIDRVLAPAGTAAVQAILQPHARFLSTRGEYTWINKYIFPGGVLVSVPAVDAILRAETGLRIAEQLRFGASYAATLREWRRRFTDHTSAVDALGFDEWFRRMWEFYLAFCEAAFASGHLDVAQLVLRRA